MTGSADLPIRSKTASAFIPDPFASQPGYRSLSNGRPRASPCGREFRFYRASRPAGENSRLPDRTGRDRIRARTASGRARGCGACRDRFCRRSPADRLSGADAASRCECDGCRARICLPVAATVHGSLKFRVCTGATIIAAGEARHTHAGADGARCHQRFHRSQHSRRSRGPANVAAGGRCRCVVAGARDGVAEH